MDVSKLDLYVLKSCGIEMAVQQAGCKMLLYLDHLENQRNVLFVPELLDNQSTHNSAFKQIPNRRLKYAKAVPFMRSFFVTPLAIRPTEDAWTRF